MQNALNETCRYNFKWSSDAMETDLAETDLKSIRTNYRVVSVRVVFNGFKSTPNYYNV